MAGFNPLKTLESLVKTLVNKVDEVIANQQKHTEMLQQHTEMLQQHTEMLQQHTEMLQQHTEMLQYIVAEVSRFKNDSDQLMISMFAFHHIYGIPFTYGDIANKGLIATRYSRKHGFQVHKTQDPRFGEVNLYETEALERCFLGFTDADYCVEQ